jgi:hypothetical protein
MKCNMWEEVGLLFISGETSKQQNKEFEEHMKACSDCQTETDSYYNDKKKFFSVELLSESPSLEIDKKIIAVCSRKPVPTTGFNLFSALLTKKAILSTFLLVFGMSTGLYFSVAYFSTGSPSALTAAKKVSPTPDVSSQSVSNAHFDKAPMASNTAGADKNAQQNKDSVKNNSGNVFSTHPQQQQKIITVDLKKE